MTTAAFDPRLIEKYSEPKHYFIFNGEIKVYRYCLVEIIDEKDIDPQLNVKETNKV